MKFRYLLVGLAALGVFATACTSTKSDELKQRDRNVDVAVTDGAFGPNGNGVVVTPLKLDIPERIVDVVSQRQANDPVVYAAAKIVTAQQDGEPPTKAALKLVKIISRNSKLIFDSQYGTRQLAGAETIDLATEVQISANGTILLIDRKPDAPEGEAVTIRRYSLATGKIDTTFGAKGTLVVSTWQQGWPGEVKFVTEGLDGRLFIGVQVGDASSPTNIVMKINGKGILEPYGDFSGEIPGREVTWLTYPNDTDLFEMRAAHMMWSGPDAGSLVIATVIQRKGEPIPFLMPYKLSPNGVVRKRDIDNDGYYYTRYFNGYAAQVSIDETLLDPFGLPSYDPYNENLTARITLATMGKYAGTFTWHGEETFPGGRGLGEYSPTFDASTTGFDADEAHMTSMKYLSIGGVLAELSVLTSRNSNFQGLGLVKVDYSAWANPGTLMSTLRLGTYPSTILQPSPMQVAANGRIYFSQRSLSTSALDAKNNASVVVGKSWGAAFDGSGMSATSAKNGLTENPLKIDGVITSLGTQVALSGEDVLSIFDEDGHAYAMYQGKGGFFIERIPDNGLITRFGKHLTSNSWELTDLPTDNKSVVIRDGFVYVFGPFHSNVEGAPSEPFVGVARYSLDTGEMDETYGKDGVAVLSQSNPWYQSYQGHDVTLILLPSGDASIFVKAFASNKTIFAAVRLPKSDPTFDLFSTEKIIRPLTYVEINPDVYSSEMISDGVSAATVDDAGRIIIVQLRRELAYDLSASWPNAHFTLRMWRYREFGKLDDSFDGGYVEHDITGWANVEPYMTVKPQVVVRADGKILVGLNGVQKPDSFVFNRMAWQPTTDVHVMARFTDAGAFDAITPPKPAAVQNPVTESERPNIPAPTEAVPVENPFTGKSVLSETVVTIPDPKTGAPEKQSDNVASSASPQTIQRLQMLATASAVDKSIGVKWAIPASLVAKQVTYEVIANPSGKTCTTTSTLCVFKGLDAWTAYSFTVSIASGAEGIAPSEPSPAVKPLRILARNKTVKIASLIVPAAKTKLKWKVSGGCRLSKDASTLTTPKDATVCTLSVKNAKSGKTPAATRSISIDVRAIVK